VLAGVVPTESGFGQIPARETPDVVAGLGEVVDAADGQVVVHCCAATPPFGITQQSGATAVSFDLATTAGRLDVDEMGEAVERGLLLWLGVVPAIGPGVPPSVRDVLAPIRQLWGRLGFDVDKLPGAVTLTPACGLAGASQGWARTALRLVTQAAHALSEAPESIPS